MADIFWDEVSEGRHQDAVRTARGMADTGDSRGHYLEALVLDEVGQYRDADKAARHAASAGHPGGLRRWALAKRRQKKYKPALRALERAARIAPDAGWDALHADWRYWAGDSTVTLEELAQAAIVDPFVRLTRAYMLMRSGRVDKAESEFEIAAGEGFSEAWVPLGNIAENRGDTQVALGWYARGVAAGDPHAMLNAGLVRWGLGEHVEAEWLFRQAAGQDRRARRWLSSKYRARKRRRRLTQRTAVGQSE
jgi:tetratricopeptide (TPR) repeat protein